MRIASFAHDSIVDGPGLRFVLFTQGCPHFCEGCHNPEAQEPSGGRELSCGELLAEIRKNPLTDGLTLSGGEPFAQAASCAELARTVRESGLNVWAYSGWTFEELYADCAPGARELLELCDVLVDSRFELPRRSLSLKWRGSGNQRVIDVPKSLASGSPVMWEQPAYI